MNQGMRTPPLTRRDLLRAGTTLAAAMLPAPLRADPYAPLPRPPRPAGAVRVRGRVTGAGRGLRRVAVSDGATVVETDRDGRYELVTDGTRAFVTVTVPAGFAIPRSPTGTARCFMSIRPGTRGEMSAAFALEPLRTSDERHALLLLADTQTEDTREMQCLHEQTVPDVRATVAALGDIEVVGVACGDIMFDRLELYPDYERAVARTEVPFFQVVGNHDLDQTARTDEDSTATFARHFGPRWYSFERGAVHYVVLDDVLWHGAGYIGYLDASQLAWLEADLARVERGRPVVVMQHIPAFGSGHLRQGRRRPEPGMAVQNREALYRLLEPFRSHILAGHTHENEHVFEGGAHEHVVGTVCGAWWSGPICYDGTPNGYGVYEVRGEEITWRHKSTGRPADHQLRLYPPGADPKAPDEIVANVWDWDPSWTVTWFEDGERRGAMARRVGLDPLSVELHTGPDLPARRTWVEPMPTAHLFYAPIARATREVRVEARDRFGRTYAATWRRPAP
jgi:hypothetical protein